MTREGPDGAGGEALRVERTVTLLPVTVPPEDFAALEEFARAIDRSEEERVVVAPREAAAPAEGGGAR